MIFLCVEYFRDADVMREKQRKKEDDAAAKAAGCSAKK